MPVLELGFTLWVHVISGCTSALDNDFISCFEFVRTEKLSDPSPLSKYLLVSGDVGLNRRSNAGVDFKKLFRLVCF